MSDCGREVFDFNIGWRFLKGVAEQARMPDFNDSSWNIVNTLQPNASGCVNYQGEAWYRKHFNANVKLKGKVNYPHYCPSIFINQGDFFRRNIPIVRDEFVFSPLFVTIVNQSKAKCHFLFLLFIFQVDMVNAVYPMFFFAKRFFKKSFLNLGSGIIFQPAHEIDLFICPFCKLPVIVIGFVEDQTVLVDYERKSLKTLKQNQFNMCYAHTPVKFKSNKKKKK